MTFLICLRYVKLCRLIAFGKFHKICKFESHVTRNDVIMMSLPKAMENADVREISRIIYHSKGLDKNYPKMQVLSNLSNFVKSYGHLRLIPRITSSAQASFIL